ncbi:MAG: hypothetical protein ACLS8D_03760 [Clostridioides difficile]
MDKVKFLINMLLAFLYPFNKHKFNGRDICIGGHSGIYTMIIQSFFMSIC